MTATIEKLIRGKTSYYRRWRAGKTQQQLDNWCTECLLRFGTLPHWTQLAVARAENNWSACSTYEIKQRKWRREMREWAVGKGIATKAYAGQFYKYYAAWYRYHWELEHGPIERQYARQMY